MATTTVKLSITSSDIVSGGITISKSFTLTDTSGTGITQTSGLNRVNDVASDTTIFSSGDFSNDEAYLFLSNTDTTKANQVALKSGGAQIAVLQGGDSIFMAVDPTRDIVLNADVATTTVEYQLFHNG